MAYVDSSNDEHRRCCPRKPSGVEQRTHTLIYFPANFPKCSSSKLDNDIVSHSWHTRKSYLTHTTLLGIDSRDICTAHAMSAITMSSFHSPGDILRNPPRQSWSSCSVLAHWIRRLVCSYIFIRPVLEESRLRRWTVCEGLLFVRGRNESDGCIVVVEGF
jgi:hypothetical protein